MEEKPAKWLQDDFHDNSSSLFVILIFTREKHILQLRFLGKEMSIVKIETGNFILIYKFFIFTPQSWLLQLGGGHLTPQV